MRTFALDKSFKTDIMFFTSKMKLSDVLISNHSLVLTLQRFKIELGFGEKTVAEVCRLNSIDPQFFLLICNVYSDSHYLPTEEEIAHTDMSGLLPYLIASHNYYLCERIPHIEQHLNRIADACKPNHKGILLRFFGEYKNEVQNHFLYEENTVFPYIVSLCDNRKSEGYSINQFEENHSNIEDKLEDLTNILIKYLPGDIMPKERISLLFDLFQLSSDLNTHALIEDKILIPYVESLENKTAAQ